MPDVFHITPESHTAVAAYAAKVDEKLRAPDRARVEEVESGVYKRWLVHNFRRQPSGAPKKMLL
jgi:hypothetical protein